MSALTCPACANAVSPNDRFCSKCGATINANLVKHSGGGSQVVNSHENQNAAIKALLSLVVFGGVLWYFYGGGLDMQVERDMQQIHNQVALDAVAQYNIAKQSGSSIDACVQAGLVSAAYLQAQDQASYARWKDVEKADCRRAGLPAN